MGGEYARKYTFSTDLFIKYWKVSTWYFEAPMNHEGTLSLCHLNKEAKKEITVILSGDGPDECMGGYPRFHTISAILDGTRKIMSRKQRIMSFISRKRPCHSNSIDEFFISESQWLNDGIFSRLRPNNPKDAIAQVYNKRLSILKNTPGTGLHRYLNYEMRTFMQDILMRTDKISMAASIEVRVPYLMPEIIEFLQGVPDKYLCDGSLRCEFGTKRILKALCSDAYGPDFAYRSKMGLSFPFISYFSDANFRNYVETAIMPGIKNRGVVDYGYVFDIWNKVPKWAQENKYDWRVLHMLWCVFSFEIWAQLYIDRNPIEDVVGNC